MPRVLPIIFVILLTGFNTQARDIRKCDIPVNLEGLWNKAAEAHFNIIDHDTLLFFMEMASKSKQENLPTEEDIKNLHNICVVFFTFDDESQYTEEDLAELLNQMQSPIWRQVKETGEQGEGAIRSFLHMEEGTPIGLAFISENESSLYFTYINGTIDTETLEQLKGNYGVPDFNAEADKKNDTEEEI